VPTYACSPQTISDLTLLEFYVLFFMMLSRHFNERAVNECTDSLLNAFRFERCEELVEEEFVDMSVLHRSALCLLTCQKWFSHREWCDKE
jgi:hypothetical protein